jgi:hypothetical protein
MLMASMVACNKEGNGNSNEGNGNEGGRQAMATRVMAIMWVMATAMRLTSNEVHKSKGKGSKDNGNNNVRVVGKEEGNGSKAMVLATRMAGKLTAMATKRVMAMASGGNGKKEGDGDGNKGGE